LSPEDWIKVSFSQLGHLETALGVLERFAERDFKAG